MNISDGDVVSLEEENLEQASFFFGRGTHFCFFFAGIFIVGLLGAEEQEREHPEEAADGDAQSPTAVRGQPRRRQLELFEREWRGRAPAKPRQPVLHVPGRPRTGSYRQHQ